MLPRPRRLWIPNHNRLIIIQGFHCIGNDSIFSPITSPITLPERAVETTIFLWCYSPLQKLSYQLLMANSAAALLALYGSYHQVHHFRYPKSHSLFLYTLSVVIITQAHKLFMVFKLSIHSDYLEHLYAKWQEVFVAFTHKRLCS